MENLNKIGLIRGSVVILMIGVFILFSQNAYAQQEVLTTQWAYNKLTVNPGYTGGKDIFSARILHRQQWVGIDGRPIATVLNAHSPLLNDRIGVGISYVHDKLGVVNTNILMGSYAYRLPFKNRTKLGIGINAGFSAFKIKTNELEGTHANDPYLQAGDVKKINVKVGTGVYYYGKQFYVGASTPNVIPNNLYKESDISDENLDGSSDEDVHIYLMAGYAFESKNKNVVIKPQAMFRMVAAKDSKAPWQMDFNVSSVLFDRVILGSTFRTTIANKNDIDLENISSVDLMLGVYITKQWFMSYAYDFTLGSLKDYDSGSHEIMLGFDMNFKKKGAFTPRYF